MMGKRILTIVGARPQFVKAAPMSRCLRERHEEILVHTGQHYDYDMSKVFFDGLDIPEPDVNLDVRSGSHAEQTGAMLVGIADLIQQRRPDMVLVYGDTNSTLAGAMAASKLNVPVGHVEAGLRSFNRSMPEEINRILTDKVSTLLFCPTEASVNNLQNEGVIDGVHLVGDVMYDVASWAALAVESHRGVMEEHGLEEKGFLLATVHRAGNTDDPEKLTAIIDAFLGQSMRIVWPVHPRTRQRLADAGLLAKLEQSELVTLLSPLGFLDFVALIVKAKKVLTDSGGVQKEACFHKTPCITLREETEWVETVEAGWNVLVGTDKSKITEAIETPFIRPTRAIAGAGLMDGQAARRIVDCIDRWFAGDISRSFNPSNQLAAARS